MPITADTLAVVAATGLGPILAVGLTIGFTYWRETSAAKYSRRLDIFRTLMSTRQLGISTDHVRALNLIEVDFYRCNRVEAEWKEYLRHLNSQPEDEKWRKTKEKLLSKLLFEISEVLGFKIPAIELFEGGYAPSAWGFRDMRYTGVLEYIHELRTGSNTLPVVVPNAIPPEPASEPPPPKTSG